jgi:nicotinic acid phosphoribosyltransferase
MKDSIKKLPAAIAAMGALAVGGAAIADAASSHGTTTTATQQSSLPAFNGPVHGTAAHEDAEKAVTGDAAAKARAAAVTAAGGGTAGAVTTDYTGNGYEVTVMKFDGGIVEIRLDSSFNAMQPFGPPPGTSAPA